MYAVSMDLVQEMAMEFDGFAPSVSDIRMLRIEECSDLRPAIDFALTTKSRSAQALTACAHNPRGRPMPLSADGP